MAETNSIGINAMTAQNTIVVSLPTEACALLADNSIDLVTALRTEGLDVNRGAYPENAPATDGCKEVALTLLAAGVTATLLAASIAKILDALGRNKKFLISEKNLVPVLDDSGDPVRDAAGQPVLYWAEEKKLIEATQVTQDNIKTSVEAGPTLLKFSLSGGQ